MGRDAQASSPPPEGHDLRKVTFQQGQTLKEPVAGDCLLTVVLTGQCKSFLEEGLGDSSLRLPQSTPCVTPTHVMYMHGASPPGFQRASLPERKLRRSEWVGQTSASTKAIGLRDRLLLIVSFLHCQHTLTFPGDVAQILTTKGSEPWSLRCYGLKVRVSPNYGLKP